MLISNEKSISNSLNIQHLTVIASTRHSFHQPIPVYYHGSRQRKETDQTKSCLALRTSRAALRFWEKKAYRRVSAWGLWHIAQTDVKHAPGPHYLHYEMSGIKYFDLSLTWIQVDILSISLRSLLLCFDSFQRCVLLELIQVKANRSR